MQSKLSIEKRPEELKLHKKSSQKVKPTPVLVVVWHEEGMMKMMWLLSLGDVGGDDASKGKRAKRQSKC